MKIRKHISISLIIVYTVFLYWLTIFSRSETLRSGCEWRPFWKFRAIADGREEYIGEIATNLFMFVPIGLLIGLFVKRRGWLVAMTTSIVLSLGIEMLQFYLKRGLFETDDIIHNTVGCLIGVSLIKMLSVILRKQGKIQDI